MKYQVGEKVKYDSDDWSFYGTITAVIENSISPCYRIHVERMEKKNCKFSITQFEFELEADHKIEDPKEKSNWKKHEDEFLKKNNSIQLADKKSTIFEQDTFNVTKRLSPKQFSDPVSVQEHNIQVISPELNQDESDILQKPNKDMPSPKKYGSWQTNFELYCSGHKSKALNTWMYQNRKQYQTGSLKKDRLEKLVQINFPFNVSKLDTPKKVTIQKGSKENMATEKKSDNSNDIWHKQLRQWKYNDDRASLQQWRQQNVKRYVEGRLSKDKIEKLKEVGILK